MLVRTEQWQIGSDAGDTEQVLAIDAANGMVYEPELHAMLEDGKPQECAFRLVEAGFSRNPNVGDPGSGTFFFSGGIQTKKLFRMQLRQRDALMRQKPGVSTSLPEK